MTDAPITISFKGGPGYDAPLIALKVQSDAEALDRIGAMENSGLLAAVGRVAHALAVQTALGKELGARPVDAPQAAGSWSDQGTQQQAQQQPYQPPQQGYQQPPQQGGWNGGGNRQQQGANPADAKQCLHGAMVFKPAGVSRRTNQPYAAFWACGANVKGCKAIN